MYRLYWSLSTGAFAPEAVLNEIGARYERVPVDTRKNEHGTPDFLKINPRGQVPALELPDGSILTESAAMMLTLGERHPEAELMPPQGQPARAQLHRWLFFAVANIYEALLRYNYSDRFTVDPMGGEAIQCQAEADLASYWGIVEQEALSKKGSLRDTDFSLADIYFSMLAAWQPQAPALLETHPRIARMVSRVSQRPAIAPLWQEHFGHKARA
ncbi:glutathione S-transferase family protein [Fodinicurvata fenggangensis]|uniref:glutathione S-transferase family protein n=1 Tax=Fodinicurvata fenggangensis TaxID=1121830 RepID=UPI00068CA902|nr:glutathione S-transferase family protein [Fodinicurvata fenggangensis]